jgi:D-3-phosphoglycerate dehydrogenase / 2-oxoglutarate reductase
MKVLLTDYAWPDLEIELGRLEDAGHELVVAEDASEASLAALAKDISAIMTTWVKVTPTVIDAAADCRLVARLGIGLDNIAVAHCTSKGIPVTNVPTYCVDEVAEHALALMLAMQRKVAFFHRQTKVGTYSLAAAGPMRRVSGQTLGIAGFGKIGKALAFRALGMGMNVLAMSLSYYDGDLPVRQVSFDELLAESDVISVHLPLTEETRRLFDSQAFAKIKPGALLINTARGPVIDPEALWEAIQSGRVAGAGLDVHDPEPPDLEHPLYRDERVVCTPHAAFTSVESLRELRTVAVGQVLDILAGKRPPHVVNPEIFA